jgi:hypothetical protein
MSWYNREPEIEVSTEIEEGRDYSKAELNAIGDAILKDDARSELCRECGERGDETGKKKRKKQDAEDKNGNPLVLEFKQYGCPNEHKWYEGEGAVRGIGGDNPILFEEHFHSRRRREIYTKMGTPDPNIVQGMYNKTHPQGRKVNSLEQRLKHGASYYR